MSLRERIEAWLRKRCHVHDWHDWYVFDSSAVTTLGPRPRFRVAGQQIMQVCACGQTKRKPLETWQDARTARKRLPYIRWGTMVHRAALPPSLR